MEQSILTKKQHVLIEKIGMDYMLTRVFYLTGGTALAAFYLGHRYSKDLDFFSTEECDVLALDVFFKKIKKEAGITAIDFQQSYNRNLFFCHFVDEVVKTEFTFFPFPRIEKGRWEYGIEIDSLRDIAVNKLFTIYQRTQARDYIDLYCICKETHFSLAELIQEAKIKFDCHIDSLQLGSQFVRVTEAKDFPRMIRKISPKEWQNFFIEEAKKLKKDIVY